MIDLKITPEGDIEVSEARGDVALTGYSLPVDDSESAACLAQLARMACLTEKGDLLIAPSLGNQLSSIMGMPNKTSTAIRGELLIRDALSSWGITNKITIETWPVDLNTIGYEVHIELGPSGRELTFTLQQAVVG